MLIQGNKIFINPNYPLYFGIGYDKFNNRVMKLIRDHSLGSVSVNGVRLEEDKNGNVNIDTANLLDGDTIIKAFNELLKVNLKLSYDSENNKLYLETGNENVVSEIDTTDFIKDGMLVKAELIDNNLVFSFNDDSEKEPIIIDLSKYDTIIDDELSATSSNPVKNSAIYAELQNYVKIADKIEEETINTWFE